MQVDAPSGVANNGAAEDGTITVQATQEQARVRAEFTQELLQVVLGRCITSRSDVEKLLDALKDKDKQCFGAIPKSANGVRKSKIELLSAIASCRPNGVESPWDLLNWLMRAVRCWSSAFDFRFRACL